MAEPRGWRALARLLCLPLLLTAAVAGAQTKLSPPDDLDVLKRQVADTERLFARSMAERNHDAFTALLSDQAVFFGSKGVFTGKAAVAAGWKGFFTDAKAPFSWEPDQVEVLADGTLALTSGPVRDPQGKLIARFNSVWRQEAPGIWRVVFDKGQPADTPPR